MDYKQELITTIHDFSCNLEFLEDRLTQLSKEAHTAVLIPSLYEELERPALTKIRDCLKDCAFVNTVIVCLYAQTIDEYAKALHFFSKACDHVRKSLSSSFIWSEEPSTLG